MRGGFTKKSNAWPNKRASKEMRKFTRLKFWERAAAPVLSSVCVCARVQTCKSGSREEMTFAWLGCITQGPQLHPPALSDPPVSSQLTGCRRGSWGRHHQRKNSCVWLERRQCMKNGGKGSGGEGK